MEHLSEVLTLAWDLDTAYTLLYDAENGALDSSFSTRIVLSNLIDFMEEGGEVTKEVFKDLLFEEFKWEYMYGEESYTDAEIKELLAVRFSI